MIELSLLERATLSKISNSANLYQRFRHIMELRDTPQMSPNYCYNNIIMAILRSKSKHNKLLLMQLHFALSRFDFPFFLQTFRGFVNIWRVRVERWKYINKSRSFTFAHFVFESYTAFLFIFAHHKLWMKKFFEMRIYSFQFITNIWHQNLSLCSNKF